MTLAAYPPPSREDRLRELVQHCMGDLGAFSRYVCGIDLYPYQLEAGRHVFAKVEDRIDDPEFVVMMSRQAGKNELSAVSEAWMLNRHQTRGGNVVKVAPTFKPQVITSMKRLERRLRNWWNRGKAKTSFGYIITLKEANISFFSADPQANVVSATADLYMEVDETQDVDETKYEKDFVPMRATTNAPVVFYGTAWTNSTLLAKKAARAEMLERRDGVRRVFRYPWWDVAEANPLYGKFVESQIEESGREHPIIKTQYCLETIEGEGKFLSEQQLALMRGDHPRETVRHGSFTYVMGIDIAGEVEEDIDDTLLRRKAPRKDSTVVTIGKVTWPRSVYLPPEDGASDEEMSRPLPTLRIVDFYWWTGRNHASQYNELCRLIEAWQPKRVVVDGGGVGAGVSSFLRQKFPGRIVVFHPNGPNVSALGYGYLALVNTGRFRMYADSLSIERAPARARVLTQEGKGDPAAREFWLEHGLAKKELRANQQMQFFVDVSDGHDDFVKSAALCAMAASGMESSVRVGEQVVFPRGTDV
jgi:hypothetical protein